jgi:hypothetical protein
MFFLYNNDNDNNVSRCLSKKPTEVYSGGSVKGAIPFMFICPLDTEIS